ncbi:hypothetical protein D3C72_2127860 [compost metagenome]
MSAAVFFDKQLIAVDLMTDVVSGEITNSKSPSLPLQPLRDNDIAKKAYIIFLITASL